jgi:hypothetical protein
MILSKRERYILIAVVAAVAIFALDRFAVTPLWAKKNELAIQVLDRQGKLGRADELEKNRKALGDKWKAMSLAGLKTDASAAESMVLHAVRDWATESRLTLSSMKPDKTEPDKQLHKLHFRATATGNMAGMTSFLWRVRNATIPIRVTELQISSRKDGVDDLTMQIGLTTIFYAPAPLGGRPAQASAGAAAAGAQRASGPSATQPQSRPARAPGGE